ncbi:hypothetical protein EsHS_00003754 [Epichloe bromicola]
MSPDTASFGIIVGNCIKQEDATTNGNAVWTSDTAEPMGDSTIEVSVLDDGNVVLYKKTAIGCRETYK